MSMKGKIFLSLTLLFSIWLLSLIVTPFVGHAATEQKNFASYDTKTGEVSYYDLLPESGGEHQADSEEGGSDSSYDPSENEMKGWMGE